MTVFNSLRKDQFTHALQVKLIPEDPARAFFKFDEKAVVVSADRDKTVIRVYSAAIGCFRTITLEESIANLRESTLRVVGENFLWTAMASKHIYVIYSNSSNPETHTKEPGLPYYFSDERLLYYGSSDTLHEMTLQRGGIRYHNLRRDQTTKGELLFAGALIIYKRAERNDDEVHCYLDVYVPTNRIAPIQSLPVKAYGTHDLKKVEDVLEITFRLTEYLGNEVFRFDLKNGRVIS
ncbi:MAG: hypothetical protein KDK62_04475 [Chlamydiia bacterium]|nr:hypothetical protein [Chlamydiia bacterium]